MNTGVSKQNSCVVENKHNALTFSVPAIRHTFQTEIITIEQYAQKLLCNRLA